jgi:hypothetical protein
MWGGRVAWCVVVRGTCTQDAWIVWMDGLDEELETCVVLGLLSTLLERR